MKWISKTPPKYFHPGDEWTKEPERSTWFPNMSKKEWGCAVILESKNSIAPIPFLKGSIFLKNYCD